MAPTRVVLPPNPGAIWFGIASPRKSMYSVRPITLVAVRL